MLGGLKPYPAYKDSGVPWLGKVPAHWEVRRAKTVFRKVERPPRDPDDVVTCFRDGVVTLRRNRRMGGFTESLKEIGYQGIRRGDLVIHAMDAFAGAIGVSDSDGKGTPVYSVCTPALGVSSEYVAATLREVARSGWILALAKGIRERSTDLRFETLAIQRLPLPPSSEQAAIVTFLRRAGREIRRGADAKRRLVTLLEEERQTIVHRLVTRGVRPAERLKDSGSRWYGRVPERWSVVSLGRVVRRAVDGPHHSPAYVDKGIPFLSARNIKVDRWSLEDAKFISRADFEVYSRRVVPERGDVLYTKGGTTGVARVVDLDFPFQVWVHVAVLKVIRTRILPEYLALVLNSPRCYEQSQLLTRGATNQDLGLTRMKQILLPLPPLNEQEEILRVASDATADLVAGIASARREIQLALELRARLIADVVTGRVDVRGAAEALPAGDGHAALTAGFDPDGEEADEEATPVASLDEADA